MLVVYTKSTEVKVPTDHSMGGEKVLTVDMRGEQTNARGTWGSPKQPQIALGAEGRQGSRPVTGQGHLGHRSGPCCRGGVCVLITPTLEAF